MSVIEEIKQRVDIVEVVSEYVSLKKAGRNFRALCPFHTEKTPSFFVFPERQSWHCFGACATGGDIFSFLMKKENIEFGEALRLLAQRAGIAIPDKWQSGVKDEHVERLYQINEAAALYYHRLLVDSPAAEPTRSYLAKRGVSPRSIEDFQLGFSLDSWDGVSQSLTQERYWAEELIEVGLLVEREGGAGGYDRFRNRLMFPIRDPGGRTVGFGGRVLNDSLPKYLNSPQTAIFDKSSILYGVDRARSAIRRQDMVIIVEGYMDVITAHQHGFDNVVASMGTSLTERQVDILKKLTKNFTMALDADAAGEMATKQELESVWHATEYKGREICGPTVEARVRIAIMPQGKDPDEVIRVDAEEWRKLTDAALPWADFVFNTVTSGLDVTNARSKSEVVEQLLPFISAMPDPIERAHYLQKLAHLVHVDEHALALARKKMSASRTFAKRTSRGSATPDSTPLSSLGDSLEEYCLFLLLHYPGLSDEGRGISPDYFDRTENRELFLLWRDSPDIKLMDEDLNTPLREHLSHLRAKELPPLDAEKQERALTECIYRLREQRLRDLKAKEKILISDAQSEGDINQVVRLEQLAVKLNSQLLEVFSEQELSRHQGMAKRGLEDESGRG